MFPPFLEIAPAKINLALHVLGKRIDGYHELDSIVAFADIADTLLFEPNRHTSLTITGPQGAQLPAGSGNLIIKAFEALGAHVKLPAMRVTLNKILPVASGIGGGSADAAAALRGALRASGSHLDTPTLNKIALSLGADVPVCLQGKACRMQGVGEMITPLKAPRMAIVLVNPLQACSTAEVFKALGLRAGQRHLTALDPGDPSSWRNDLSRPAMAVCPVIQDVLAALNEQGAYSSVRMSGSGATCFGLTRDINKAEVAAAQLSSRQPGWWVRAAKLL